MVQAIMNARQAQRISVGDVLRPIPDWNASERLPNQLHEQTKVLGISHGQCQTGVMLKVKSKGGFIKELDAGWFYAKQLNF